MLTVKQLATLIGVSISTVRLWSNPNKSPGVFISPYLSEHTRPEPGSARRFTEEDLAVYKTVKALADINTGFEEIGERLEAGERLDIVREGDIAPESLEEKSLPAESERFSAFSRTLALYEERDREIRGEIAALYDKLIEVTARVASAETERDLLRERLKKRDRSFWDRLLGKN